MPGGDGTTVVRRIRRRSELLRLLDPHEPRATPLIVDVNASALLPWRMKAWAVRRDGVLGAIVVTSRAAFDRWYARCVVVDPAVGPTVAGLVDASPAWTLSGSGLDIGPVQPHLTRARDLVGMPWIVVEDPAHMVDEAPDDALIRAAGRRDRRALRELYRGYELAIGETSWQERSALRTLLRSRTVLLAEEHGQVMGAVMVGGPTSRYVSVDRLTVLPAFRRRGLSWQFVAHLQRLANERHVGGTAAVASSNPMEFADEHLSTDWWLTVVLREPRRFRGQHRLRMLYRRVGTVDRRRPEYVRASRRPPD